MNRHSRIARAPSGYRCGESHHKTKLSDAQVREIRQVYEKSAAPNGHRKTRRDIGYSTLARTYGVGVSTIRDICTYRTRINA